MFIETSILIYWNPQIGWFIKENPKMKWMMWGTPISGNLHWLVFQPLWKILVNWDVWKNKKCSNPPTSPHYTISRYFPPHSHPPLPKDSWLKSTHFTCGRHAGSRLNREAFNRNGVNPILGLIWWLIWWFMVMNCIISKFLRLNMGNIGWYI